MKPPSGKPLGVNLGFKIGVTVLLPLLNATTKRTWINMEKVPKSGAVIFYSNHVSYMDALVLAHYLYKSGRAPRFIGKEAVFKIPVVGWVLKKAEQIPVKRESESAAVAFKSAIDALSLGHAIAIYPEGTLTRDENLWPMTGKSGAVRMAVAAKVPLIPIAQWGDHKMLAPYSKKLKLFPRTAITLNCGDPIDLSKWRGKEDDHEAMAEATMSAMKTLAEMVGELRNELPPTELFDVRKSNLPRTGNYRKNRHR